MFGATGPNVFKADIGLGEWATDNTVRAMAEHIRQSEIMPIVRTTAEGLIRFCPSVSLCEIKSIFNWVKTHMRYTRDYYRREFFKTPEVHLRQILAQGMGYGDCDDFTILLTALLRSVGWRMRIMVIQSRWNRTGGFNHIFPEVFIKGKWYALDGTAKDKPIFYRPKFLRYKVYGV